jgi:hypothetical protein
MDKILERHNQIEFNEAEHIYTLKGDDTKFTSVTTFIGQFHEGFDAEAISSKISRGCEIKKAQLLCDWAQSGPHGTKIHRFLELYAENAPADFTEAMEEWQFVEGTRILAELKKEGWRTFKAEIILWLKEYGLCGTCDLLLTNDKGELLIADWKTCKDIPTNAYGKKFSAPLQELDCSKHNKYALQLSVYQYFLEQVCDAKVVGRRLLWVPQKGPGAQIETAYLKKEVELLLKNVN